MVKFAVILACVILAGLSVFQTLLILGFPLGNFAWGGQHKVLPKELRISSFVAIVLYLLFVFILLEKSKYISVLPTQLISRVGIWFLTVYFLFGTVMNALSRSPLERYTMIPVSLTLAILSLIIALH